MKQIDSIVSSVLLSYKMGLYEQEEKLEIPGAHKKFSIGLPKETEPKEKRVILTPDGVSILVSEGYQVIIEKEAAKGAGFLDMEYSDAGALIVSSSEEAHKADVVLKINHPRANEVSMMKEGAIVISSLHCGKPAPESLRTMMKRKIIGIAAEHVSDNCGVPISNSMLPIEGKAVMLMAAELLTNEKGGQGILLGGIAGISPVEIVIIGAGIIAEYAAQVATALGGTVKVFSSSLDALLGMKQKIGQSLFTNILQPQTLSKAFKTADVLINTLSFEDNTASFILTEDLLSTLKKRAIVLDMSIKCENKFDSSTNNEHNKYLFNKYEIIYHSINNISSRVAHTSSQALNNVAIGIIHYVTQYSSFTQVLRENKGLRKSVYVFNGILTNIHLGRVYNIPSQDIDLLLAAF